MSCKRPLSTLTSLNVRLVQKKTRKMTKTTKDFNILGSKIPKNDDLTLNYGLPSSFTTLSNGMTTNRR